MLPTIDTRDYLVALSWPLHWSTFQGDGLRGLEKGDVVVAISPEVRTIIIIGVLLCLFAMPS
jgi:hypothetical protein